MRPSWFYLLAGAIIAADQHTKRAVMDRIPYGASERSFAGLVWLTPTHNTGGAFSLFQQRNGAFVVVACLAIAAIVAAYHRFQRRDAWASAALSLALGGAIGNLIDRVRYGYVQDFVDVRVWPVFNLADSAISVGIVVLAALALFKRPPEPRRPEPPAA